MAMTAMVKWKTFCRPRRVDHCIDRINEAAFLVTTAMVQAGLRIDEAGGWFPVFEDSPMITRNTRSQTKRNHTLLTAPFMCA